MIIGRETKMANCESRYQKILLFPVIVLIPVCHSGQLPCKVNDINLAYFFYVSFGHITPKVSTFMAYNCLGLSDSKKLNKTCFGHTEVIKCLFRLTNFAATTFCF